MATGAATSATRPNLPGLLGRLSDLALPVGVIACVLVILVPLPPMLLDVLLACNVAVAVIMLLTTIYVRTPLEFNIFPSLLLATTLARLVLNVASTRLILTRAETHGPLAAGDVIKAFGEFVAGDKLVVGLILFLIIVVIQFVVITKGATRISEVAARFALDGMPGRQMAIDADLNAKLISEQEARRRRQEIQEQADFFGAMDGASKFVRGDAIAGIVITVVNIVGGLVIGMAEAGMAFGEASRLFTMLTIGDGLVSQVPAFLISVAAGLLVTRSSSSTHLPREFVRQLFSRPQALFVAAGFVSLLAATNLPPVPMLSIAAACVGLGLSLNRKESEAQVAKKIADKAVPAKPTEERIEDFLTIDPMEVELGLGLVRLADPKRGGDLLDRIQQVRKKVAGDVGILMPKVRIRDNIQLDQTQYRIKIADMPVAEGNVYPAMFLALSPGPGAEKIDGLPAKDPVLGSPAVWIEPSRRERAELFNYAIVEPAGVLATHLTETVRRHADELLTRDAAKHLLDELKKTLPTVVDELIPGQLKLAEVQQILQMLLREGVPVRQLSLILETLGDFAPRVKDPVLLTEAVRNRLARTISTRFRNDQKQLFCLTLDPALEDRIRAGLEHTERGLFVRMSPQAVEVTCNQLAKELEKLRLANRPPIVLVSPQIRAGLKMITQHHLPNLIVLSHGEITRDTRIEALGMVSDPPARK